MSKITGIGNPIKTASIPDSIETPTVPDSQIRQTDSSNSEGFFKDASCMTIEAELKAKKGELSMSGQIIKNSLQDSVPNRNEIGRENTSSSSALQEATQMESRKFASFKKPE
jgi:hypothetical protein